MTDADPAPMTRDAPPRHDIHAHDHAVCIYDAHDDLTRPLARFVEQGLARNELVVFVHSFGSEAEAWGFLEKVRPGARDLGTAKLVLVSLYREAFEGEGRRIDFDHVGKVVEGLVRSAEESGRAGTRIFVDASRMYFTEQRAKEWFEFESWLGRRLQARVGLVCAYQRQHATRPDLFAEMLRTHAYRFDAPPAKA